MSRLIKKYKNRRLYDTETSQYITVEELQKYVLDGLAFRVEEATTNNDITTATLLQILVEMESGASQFLSADMLKQLIIAAHHPMSQAFQGGMQQMFNVMEQSMKNNPYTQATETLQQQMKEMATQWQGLFKI